MLTHPNCHLGDSWYYADGDTVHAYYLVCPDMIERHTAWDIAHATTTDLINWDLHGIVVERGQDDEWDGVCLATGSVIRHDGQYLMAYTARWNQTGVATGLATSDDLHTWTKHPDNPNTRPGPPYLTDRQWTDRPPTHWRDPFLFHHNGTLYQYVAAARDDAPEDAGGTVGVATATGLSNWILQPPPDIEPIGRELECPQVHRIDGEWFLIFSAFPALFSQHTASSPESTLGHGTYAMHGDSPTGPFRFVQKSPILPVDHPDQLYAGQILTIVSDHYLMGTVWQDDAPDYLTNAIPIIRDGRRLEVA